MKVVSNSGKYFLSLFNDKELFEILDFYRLEYFVKFDKDKNYILLLTEDRKIAGQITYIFNKNDILLSSISITKNNQNNGYSSILLDSFFSLVQKKGINHFFITPFSEDGEKKLFNKIEAFSQDNYISYDFIQEKDFF